MHIAFRVDASIEIGTGHVMRCLTLADALRESGAQSTFIYRPHDGHLLNLISQRGHKAIALSPVDESFIAPIYPAHSQWLGTDWISDAEQTCQVLHDQVVDWLVVDHYALDHRWEQALRSNTHRIMAIDDLGDRPHDCDLLLDQNLGRLAQEYKELIGPHTQTLIGPAYALLRPEFTHWREFSLQRRVQPQLKKLLISMGGVDQVNATGKVLDTLKSLDLPDDLDITVVMGQTAPWLDHVKDQAGRMPRHTQVLSGVNNMAQLMAESDFCIGAAGGSAWERCALGLPTLVLILAANQKSGAMALKAHGAAWLATDTNQLMKQLISLFSEDNRHLSLKDMSQAAAQLTTGNGATHVVDLLLADYV